MEKEFNTVPISRLILRLGLPAMAAQIFNILYSIIDRIFVGHIPQIGELALASIGLCAPALTAITGFASMIGVGGSAIMSLSVGKKDYKTAQQAVNNAFLMLCTLSCILTFIVILFRRPLLYLLGCSDTMYPYASKYFSIYLLGTIFVLLGSGMNLFVLGQGFARQGMIAVTLGAVVNIILDPVLIYYCNLGVTGAALATIIAQFVTMIYVLLFLQRPTTPYKIKFGDYKLQIMLRIITIGCMSFFIIFLDNLIIIVLNSMLRKYGGAELGDQYIACAAIVQGFMTIAYCPANGITSGCGTLYSFHYGAGNYKKLMQIFRGVLILCALYMGLLSIFAQISPQTFVRLFTQDEAYIMITSSFIKKYTLGLTAVAVQYAFVDGLTAMGKVSYAIPLSWFRKILYMLAVILLPMFLPLENIFWCGTISDIAGASFTLLIFFTIVKKKLSSELQ